MLSSLNNLLQLRWNLYSTDFLDVLIIAVFIYSLIVFFTRTRTYLVFLGLATAAVLYIFAKYFNLYLTLLTLKYFAGASIIIFVVIFQTEIRKYFEFLGLVGTRQIKVGSLATRSPSTAEIIQACVRMAQSKIGALIIIQGKDALDPFIDSGVQLDGVISEEVLLSIFDPTSEGHDGALIISNNRISKFGTQLPLSTNFKEIGKRGTRHSAALGLSENTDALCVVVSEEKGKISLCREGKLKTIEDPSNFERELEKFIKAKFPNASKFTGLNLVNFLRHNFMLKVGAVALAGTLWYFTAYKTEIIEKSFIVPVSFGNIPKDTIIESYSPKEVKIVTSGRGIAVFTDVTAENFEVNVEETTIQSGLNKVELNRKKVTIPAKLTFVAVEPSNFLFTANKRFITNIRLSAKVIGTVGRGFELKNVTVTPETVSVWVPEGITPPLEIFTDTINISNLSESVIIPTKLVIPEDLTLVEGSEPPNVAVTIGQK